MIRLLKSLRRGTVTVIKGYLAVIVLFAVFSVPYFFVTLMSKFDWMSVYSIATLVIMTLIIFSLMSKLAISEEFRDTIGPLGMYKGFVCGALAMVLFVVLFFLVVWLAPYSSDWHIKPDIQGLLKVILTPHIYWYSRGCSNLIFLTAYLYPPVIAGLGYIAGIKKIDIDGFIDEKIFRKPRNRKAKKDDYKR